MRRHRVGLFCLVLALPSAALADVVQSPPESCPPGLFPHTSHRGPTCTPRRCSAPSECPEGSACVETAWCQREVEIVGRMGPHQGTVTAGRCEPDGTCSQHDPRRRRPADPPWECRRWQQCEPTVQTPAWDAATRTWTREPHRVEAPAEDEAAPAEEEAAPAEEEAAPAEDEAAQSEPAGDPNPPASSPSGCAIGFGSSSGALGPLAAALALSLFRTRRRR